MDNKNPTLEQARLMSDAEHMDYLCEYWELDRNQPIVYGRLKKWGNPERRQFWNLCNVRNPSGKPLCYPFFDEFETDIFIGPCDKVLWNSLENDYVALEIELASNFEREKRRNHFHLATKPGTTQCLTHIPSNFVVTYNDGSIVIEESIYNEIAFAQHPDKTEQLQRIEAILAPKQQLVTQLKRDIEELEDSKKEYKIFSANVKALKDAEKIEQNVLKEMRSLQREVQTKLDSAIQQDKDIGSGIDQKQALLAVLQDDEAKTSKTVAIITEKLDLLEQSKKSLEDKIETLKKDEADLVNKTKQLREMVKSRADLLRHLEFIDDDQYNGVMGETKEREKPTGEELPFDGPQLEKDFKKLAQYLQVYLFEQKDIMYPLYLLKDFLTLLRTHDFIILSGLSGAGKTLLVKAVAAALGGLAKIVPVKPNWTSSEDLLGYYNPLQRAYLSTPFLDALVEAKRNPQLLYLICLDEMNLARVEYYFADFLSALEEREQVPEIKLYSHEESGNVLAEFIILLTILDDASGTSGQPLTFGDLLTNKELNQKLHDRMGTNDNESFAQLYSRLQRMVSQLLNIPPTLEVPANVRFIGAINVDQTTNSLSPKVIDRAHIIQFQSPFKYGGEIEKEVEQSKAALGFPDYSKPVYLQPNKLGDRKDYPSYSKHQNDKFVQTLVTWITNHFEPLGIDVGFRTIRQALNYRELALAKDMGDDEIDVLNSLMLYKILPRFSFEGNTEVKTSEGPLSKHEWVKRFNAQLKDKLEQLDKPKEVLPRPRSYEQLDELWQKANSSDDKLYNYWS